MFPSDSIRNLEPAPRRTEKSNDESRVLGPLSSGFHILVVDDDPEILEGLNHVLVKMGHRVSLARDGNQALAHVETHRPDLIVLDLMMPRRSGFLVLEQLCQTTSAPIPVVVITGNEGKRHRDYAFMLGASDYLQKPFPLERLLESINGLLKIN